MTVATAGFIALAMAWPRSAAPATGPQQILLSGLIRDFEDMFAPAGHPDFESANFNPQPSTQCETAAQSPKRRRTAEWL